LTNQDIARWRLHTLGLDGSRHESPRGVVEWLGAVQSQDFGPALWSVGQRTSASTAADVERLVADGHVLRTHVLRPTWHFVLPADIRWMLAATAPRVRAVTAHYNRRAELDAATLSRALTLVVEALRGGKQLTKRQLEDRLERGGIHSARALRMMLILMHAELTGLICSGARRGKQQAYALLDERAPLAKARLLEPEEAQAELTRRYFIGHGPATVKDFRWWSSLTVAEIHRGLELIGAELEHVVVDGNWYWFGTPPPTAPVPSPSVHLLHTYDEYVVGYSETKYALDIAGLATPFRVANMIVLLDSQVAGFWKRKLGKDSVAIEVSLHRSWNGAERAALEAEAARYGLFFGLEPLLTVRTP
jgi:hypothetical protein